MNPRRKKRLTIILAIYSGSGDRQRAGALRPQSEYRPLLHPSELVEGKGPDKIKPEEGQRLRIGGLSYRDLYSGIPRASRLPSSWWITAVIW